jgi:hypothetical protein
MPRSSGGSHTSGFRLRANAANLLARIDPAATKEAVPALIRVLKGNAIVPLIRCCFAFFEGMVLSEFKSHYWEEDQARCSAAHALGVIGPSQKGTVPALKSALDY